jgi:hypothetical protein
MRALVGMVGTTLLLASCGGGASTNGAAETGTGATSGVDASTSAPAPIPEEEDAEEEAVEFTWTTSYVADGYGVTVEVTGLVGEGWASYTMESVPLLGTEGGDYADLIPMMVGAGINGFADSPSGPDAVDRIDPAGATEVLVDGDRRWYRIPWLLDEAPFALGDAEWVEVDASSPAPPIDLATYVIAERFDHALGELRRAADTGAALTPPPQDDEIAALFGPWVGADGSVEPTGHAAEGEARWGVTYTYEPDGVDGFARTEVSWHATTDRPALAPDRSIDVGQVSAAMR